MEFPNKKPHHRQPTQLSKGQKLYSFRLGCASNTAFAMRFITTGKGGGGTRERQCGQRDRLRRWGTDD